MTRLFEEESWNYKLIVIPIMLLFITFIIWASNSKIDEVVRGEGKVVPSGQTKVIQHLEGGIISSILVQEGDEINKGDTLYEISQAFFTADFNTKAIKLKSLQAQAIRIMAGVNSKSKVSFPDDLKKSIPAIISNEQDIFKQEKQANKQRIQMEEDKLSQKNLKYRELRIKKENLDIELRLSIENMKILDNMYKKKVISKQKYLKELQIKQSLITKVSNIKNLMPITRQEINEVKSKIKSVKAELKSKLLKEYAKIKVEMNILQENEKANKDRNFRQAIVSPVNGTIQKLYFYTQGGIIQAGDKVAEVTPKNDTLIIEAKIKTSDRALVYSGQDVKIAITAYDTSKYGLIKGKVLFVSADSQVNQNSVSASASYYVVRVKANIEGFAPDLPILPGMIANVNILTGKKTIMQYIIKPLKDISRNSLTEK